MFMRVLLGSFLAAVLMFFWGFLVWVISPLSTEFISAVPNEEAMRISLREIPESGAYFVPFSTDKSMTAESQEAWADKHIEGPIAKIFLLKEGTDPMTPVTLVHGFIHYLFSAILMACLLKAAAPALTGFTRRFGFVVLAGLVAAVYSHGADPIWFYYPWDYTLFIIGTNVTTWVVAAAPLAALVRVAKPTENAA
jgi:hypothetical protein